MLKKLVIVIIIIIIALPLSGLLLYLGLGKAELRKQKQAYLDAGYSLDVADFITPEIPDDVNAAIAYKPIFAFLDTLTEEERKLLGNPSALNDPALPALLAKCGPMISALHAAADRPQCRWEVPDDAWIENLPMPDLRNTITASVLLESHARLNAAQARELNQNRDGLIIQDIETILRFAIHLSEHSNLVSQHVARNHFLKGIRLYEETFRDHSAPPNKVANLLANVDHRANFRNGLQGEFLIFQNLLDEMIDDGSLYEDLRIPRLASLTMNWDRAFYLRTLHAAIDETTKPLYEADPILDPPWYAYVSRQLTPPFESLAIRIAVSQVRIEMLRTAEQLRAYKSAHGAYPATGVLTMPLCPTSGKPFRYEVVDEGFVISNPDGVEDASKARWTWEN